MCILVGRSLSVAQTSTKEMKWNLFFFFFKYLFVLSPFLVFVGRRKAEEFPSTVFDLIKHTATFDSSK